MKTKIKQDPSDLLTASQAARAIGVTTGRIRQMLAAGEIRGEKLAWLWVIPREEVERVAAIEQTIGRPRVGKPSR